MTEKTAISQNSLSGRTAAHKNNDAKMRWEITLFFSLVLIIIILLFLILLVILRKNKSNNNKIISAQTNKPNKKMP